MNSASMSHPYDFADVYDCREVPNIKHFIVILGTDSKNVVLYSKVLSRVYKAFDSLSEFLDECKQNSPKIGCKIFDHNFGKEKGNLQVIKYCNPKHAFFLDRSVYSFLDVHSLLSLNSDPDKTNSEIFDNLRQSGKMIYKGRLVGPDYFRLKTMIDWSDTLSQNSKTWIGASFNKGQKQVRNEEEKIMAMTRKA